VSNLSIFNQEVPSFLQGANGLNDLTKSLAGKMTGGGKRISIRGGVFRKIVGGEEVGKITSRELNVIIVNAAKGVSRIYYAGKYDPNAIVPPTCVSNDGVHPDTKDEGKQSDSCATCAQNIAGSGNGNSRACRYTRKIAIILEGDSTGDVYQLQLPSTSIFGKGEGNVHPFESYIKYVAGNGRNINQIVTQISLDTDSDTPKLLFSPARHITEEEWALSSEAGDSLEAKNAITLTVAQTDGVKKPTLAAPAVKKPVTQMEPDEEVSEPTKRATKKVEVPPPAGKKSLGDVINAWSAVD
jgi:hypothetical protein